MPPLSLLCPGGVGAGRRLLDTGTDGSGEAAPSGVSFSCLPYSAVPAVLNYSDPLAHDIVMVMGCTPCMSIASFSH